MFKDLEKIIKELYLKGIKRLDIASKLGISLKATQSIIDRNKHRWREKIV